MNRCYCFFDSVFIISYELKIIFRVWIESKKFVEIVILIISNLEINVVRNNILVINVLNVKFFVRVYNVWFIFKF